MSKHAIKRIGVFAGAFDPVHSGHVSFALQAMEAAGLDDVIFLPERQPRHKTQAPEHYAHRVAMIKRAIKPHRHFSVLELVDRNFTVSRTLPQLEALFRGDELVLLVGSDVLPRIPDWAYSKRLLQHTELVAGIRSEHTIEEMQLAVESWPVQPRDIMLVDSYAADISSARIRGALRSQEGAKGLLDSVKEYARREWLYVSPGIVVRKMTGDVQ